MTPVPAPAVWALVPARGGSKSIPYKNLAPLAGRPLLAWGVAAARAAGCCARIVCSTDDDRIAACAVELGIEVDRRPAELATDMAAVADVARDFLRRQTAPLPDILLLVQPTSPFLRPADVTALVDAMAAAPDARSGQTVTPIPHNYHAWNQRVVEDGRVRFMYAAERRSAYNKQKKPHLYSFGNLVAVRPQALLDGGDFFAEPSVAAEIHWPYNIDVDAPDDLRLAEALIAAGMVSLAGGVAPTAGS